MSKLADYRAIERQLAELLEAQEKLSQDKGFQKAQEFEVKLLELLDEYALKPVEAIAILYPELAGKAPGQVTARRRRVAKTYRNPHTGEEVVTRGGNHKTLAAWRKEHGSEQVASWVQPA